MSNDKDPVKAAVAAHWNRRAPTFDSDFGHSIATADERAAWDRIIGLIADGRDTGIDFAAWMLREAREKAAATGAAIRFEEGDAENLPFAMSSFDLVVSRHVLWTLPHPEAAVAEWVRVLRPGGRLVVIDSQSDPGARTIPSQNARASAEYAGLENSLPFLGGRPPADIEALFVANGLVEVGHDPLTDLVEAHNQRLLTLGMPRQPRRRYVAWGNRPH